MHAQEHENLEVSEVCNFCVIILSVNKIWILLSVFHHGPWKIECSAASTKFVRLIPTGVNSYSPCLTAVLIKNADSVYRLTINGGRSHCTSILLC
jgi:hypothetical protein